MSIQADLAELEQQHRALEREIEDALAHVSSDDLKLAELKRRKLHLKDEIARLTQQAPHTVHYGISVLDLPTAGLPAVFFCRA